MTQASVQLYRLLRRFEQGPGGGPALTAYLCPAGKWTVAFGCTKHKDGSPIRDGDTITEADVYPYTEAAVERVRADLRRIVKRDLTPYQEAALGSLVFNLGGEALRKSERLLPTIESGRWEDAADVLSEYYRAWGRRDGKWHRMAMYGLRIRRLAEGCVLNGLDWEEACQPENIAFPRKLEWQPDWTDGVRTGGRYFDVVDLPKCTDFAEIHEIAQDHPLPPLTDSPDAVLFDEGAEEPEAAPVAVAPVQSPAIAISPAAPATGPAAGTPEPIPTPVPADLAVSPTQSSGTKSPPLGPVVAPPTPASPRPVPLPPKLPDAPIPVGQQREAVDGTRNGGDWSSGTKAMWMSRRFYGLVLIMAGRLWMLKTGSNAFLGTVSDPLVMEFVGGFGVMIAGEIVQYWGQRKATRALR
jgi:lysozyme